MTISRTILTSAALAAIPAGLSLAAAGPAAAQRAVVQPLPPAASSDLSEALRRLASNARDVDALISAGNASLELDDIDAAIGFFGRAEDLSPGDPRIKAGMAASYVRRQRPVEALRLFDEAESAGILPVSMAADRGLAHDLVGNNNAARLDYMRAIGANDTPETRRRLALSYAISGDKENFEATLLPLLSQRDLAAYRTRAFGLAILGRPEEAVAIVDAVMPQAMAQRVEPYLQYMRQLTPSQQAAAANLGIFPRAAAIGRDDPRIVAARRESQPQAIAGVDLGMTPSGQPLGAQDIAQGDAAGDSTPQTTGSDETRLTREQRQALLAQRRQRGRLRSAEPRQVRLVQPESQPVSETTAPTGPAATVATRDQQAQGSAPAVRPTERGELPPVAQAGTAANPAVDSSFPEISSQGAPTAPARTSRAQTTQAQAGSQAQADPVPTQSPSSSTSGAQPMQTSAVSQISLPPSAAARTDMDDSASSAVTVAALDPDTQTPAPGFDLSSVPSARADAAGQADASVSTAFADLMSLPEGRSARASGEAVDITAISIPREEPAAEAAPEPAAPIEPSRIWVQVATGRDRSALRWDWRRFAREAPDILVQKGPFVASWGETNRLLAGPYDSRADANAAVNALAEQGIGAFRFTSEDGQRIERLGD